MASALRPRSCTARQATAEAGKLLDITARIVPVVRVAATAGQCGARPCRRGRWAGAAAAATGSHRVAQSVVPAVEGRRPLGEERPDDFQRLLEAGEALGDRAGLDAVGLTTRARTSRHPAPARVGLRRRCRPLPPCWRAPRVAVRHAGDHDAAAQPSRCGRAASPSTSSLRGRLLGAGAQGVEVVVDPGVVEHVETVPDVPELGELPTCSWTGRP